MKVLWYANTPCSAADKLGFNINSGGWLRSLEEELNNVQEMELAICFYSYQALDPFMYNGTQFYPVLRKGKKNKFSRLIQRIFINRNYDEREVNELKKVINLFRPDIIHVHGTEDNFGLVQYQTDIPVVISIQGLLNPISEKYFSGVPESIASRHEGILPKLIASGIARNFKLFQKNAEREKRILKEAKFIFGRTEWDRKVTRVLAPNSQYFVVNEILRPSFYKNQWSKTEFGSPLQIVSIMGDALYKGFETILNTAQILCENSDLKFVWKIIGLHEKSSSVRIVKKWKGFDFQNIHIDLLGSKNEKEIIEILLSSDIYCQTSHIENSPNSLCEAMMLGMPIISSNAGGADSLLNKGKEGILIQDGDCYIFAGSILDLQSNFIKAMEMGKSARHSAFNRHCVSEILNSIFNFYYSQKGC